MADQTVSELDADEALPAITARHGERTADFVAMQLEYPRR